MEPLLVLSVPAVTLALGHWLEVEVTVHLEARRILGATLRHVRVLHPRQVRVEMIPCLCHTVV